MAAPNIVEVSSIFGKTAVANVTTVAANIVENVANSNSVFKINSLVVSNIDGTNAADITVDLLRSFASYKIAFSITVPSGTSFTAITKDMSFYLEEGDAIRCLASANNDLQAICGYEEIS